MPCSPGPQTRWCVEYHRKFGHRGDPRLQGTSPRRAAQQVNWMGGVWAGEAPGCRALADDWLDGRWEMEGTWGRGGGGEGRGRKVGCLHERSSYRRMSHPILGKGSSNPAGGRGLWDERDGGAKLWRVFKLHSVSKIDGPDVIYTKTGLEKKKSEHLPSPRFHLPLATRPLPPSPRALELGVEARPKVPWVITAGRYSALLWAILAVQTVVGQLSLHSHRPYLVAPPAAGVRTSPRDSPDAGRVERHIFFLLLTFFFCSVMKRRAETEAETPHERGRP